MSFLLTTLVFCNVVNPYRVDYPEFPEGYVEHQLRYGYKTAQIYDGLLPTNSFWTWLRYKRESSPTLRNGELRFDHFHPVISKWIERDNTLRQQPIPLPKPPIPPIPVPEPELPPHTPRPPIPNPSPNGDSKTPNVIPEPATAILLTMGVIIIGFILRKYYAR